MSTDLSTILPGYAVERELGRGAMGVVHLARHEQLNRHVAVKELQGTLAADPAIRARFVVEAEAMASFDHPHIVPVYDFVQRDDRCALVMEQLPGGTVWDRFVNSGITMPQAVAIALATCSAMSHAHGRGVLHRDIKPENLMFDGAGGMKVTDFGIARMVNGSSTKATLAGSVLGTPAYMAPEQAEGQAVDESADVYASATMLYELLSGRLPFEPTDSLSALLMQRITKDPTPLSAVAPHVPEPIALATMSGLARERSKRVGTAEQFGVAVARAATAAWGTGWLGAAGVEVLGSNAITEAATTGTAHGTPAARGDARATVMPNAPQQPSTNDASSAAPGTVAPGTVSPETDTPDATPAPEAPEPTPVAASAPTPIAASISPATAAEVVRPSTSDRNVGRAKADQIDELIDISEVLKPPSRPIAQYAIAAALLIAGLAWALVGGGETTGGDNEIVPAVGWSLNDTPIKEAPVDIDLNSTLSVNGLGDLAPSEITLEQFGIPFATIEGTVSPDGTIEFDPGFAGRITSGAAVARVTSDNGTVGVTDITGTHPWYLTAGGIASVLVFLFAVATIESNLRSLRRGKSKFTSHINLVLAGAFLGASAAALATIVLGVGRGTIGLIGPAALCAAGAVALGIATNAGRARRRAAKQIVRREAIKALASR